MIDESRINSCCSNFNDSNIKNVFQKIIKHLRNKGIPDIGAAKISKDDTGLFVQSKKGTSKVQMSKSVMKEFSEEIRRCSDKHRFVFSGKLLMNDDLTMEECGIKDNCVIDVVDCRAVEVIVEALDGLKIMLEVRKDDRMVDVAKKLQERVRFNQDEHALGWGGSTLNSVSKTIQDYGIVDFDILKVVALVKDEMLINIRTWDGKDASLEVRESDTIYDVKIKIHEKTGLSIDEQELLYEEDRLYDDNMTVLECGIDWDSTVEVEAVPRARALSQAWAMDEKCYAQAGRSTDNKSHHNGWETICMISEGPMRGYVSVRSTAGKIKKCNVTMTGLIMEMKKDIMESLGLVLNDHLLFSKGKVLKDRATINFSDLGCSDIIDVVSLSCVTLDVSVQVTGGSKITFSMTNRDMVINVKRKIQDELGVTIGDQIVMVEGRALIDDLAIMYNCMTDKKGVIHVSVVRRIPVIISTIQGKEIPLEISNSDTIDDLKTKIEKANGISAVLQMLIFEEQTLEDDNKLVEECRIVADSVIHVLDKFNDTFKIIVKTMPDISNKFTVTKIERIIDLKKKMEAKTGLQLIDQIAILNGKVLDNGATVLDCGISQGDVVHILDVTRLEINVQFKTANERTIMCTVSKTDTIGDVKQKIGEKVAIPSKEQTLKLKGRILRDDSMMVFNCNITETSVIDVSVISKIAITIVTTNMETVSLELLNIDRIIDVKKKIQDKIGLPLEEQILMHKEIVIIDDNMTVDEYEIRDENDIVVTAILGHFKKESRGICLIINNENFTSGHNIRIGSRKDEENIHETFSEMQYEVKPHQDVTKSQMNAIIQETKDDVKSCHMMLIVFVLSHGDKKGVFMSDGQQLKEKEFLAPFTNGNFSKFAGKPKVFFFSCCRGTDIDEGVSSSLIETDGDTTGGIMHPLAGDFFVGYATCEEYMACRSRSEGTVYVKHLCDVIRKYPSWTLAKIHQEVQSQVSKYMIDADHGFQVPCYSNMLTKSARFME